MADLILRDGRIVTLSDEDLEWASSLPWRTWFKAPNAAPQIVADQYVNGAAFRLRLHREVAVRENPALARLARRLRVLFKNGDPFDVRRENLIIDVRPLRRGRPHKDARPKGYATKRKKAPKHGKPRRGDPSPLWNPAL